MNSDMWIVYSIVLFASTLSVISLFVVWRINGGIQHSDALSTNVLMTISQMRQDYEKKIEEIHIQFDKEMAEIRSHYEKKMAESTRQIAELEKQVHFLIEQLISAGGKMPPVLIPQMDGGKAKVVYVSAEPKLGSGSNIGAAWDSSNCVRNRRPGDRISGIP